MLTPTVPRGAVAAALSIWQALVLREATTRLALKRGGWFWVLAEPAEQIVYVMLLHGLLRHLAIPGVNVALFIGVGVLPFFMMRSVALRGIDAITANMALLTYRQIKPFDLVFARAVLEVLLYLLVGTLLVAICAGLGIDVAISSPLTVLTGCLLLTGFGFGLALTVIAIAHLLPEIAQIVRMAFGPLYLLSATMYPATLVPPAARALFFLNPLVHGVEMVRSGYFGAYRTPDRVSPAYLALWTLALLATGLLLHVRFGRRLVEK
ncbi:ABC transporter permease [Robbsia sp. Bb-Pol-6]|uniref:Transport permease protein n=1 Tax=Robbsia betulipollinis TaxID=2981849 RepID=A0ABT3ZLQ2_9BURK|nr:ABC transporter permease [Robbsia betulipollinis]MCY0386883.1 ABC transporter permease [Robbsia betulipollinis]